MISDTGSGGGYDPIMHAALMSGLINAIVLGVGPGVRRLSC